MKPKHRTSTHTPKALYFCDNVYEVRWYLWDSRPSPQDPDAGTAKHSTSDDIYNQDVRMGFGVVVIYYWSILKRKKRHIYQFLLITC